MQVMELCSILESVNTGEKASSIVSALRKDELIWTFFNQSTRIQDEQIADLIKEGNINPGKLGLLAFNRDLLVASYPDCSLQVSLLEDCMLYYETFLQQHSPPISLQEAVKLAIVLIEKRKIAPTWRSIWLEIINRMQITDGLILKEIWGSSLSVAINLIKDTDGLLADLLRLQTEDQGIDLLIHGLLSLPEDLAIKAEMVFKAFSDHQPEIIEKTLFRLISINERNLAETIARLFLDRYSASEEESDNLEGLFGHLELALQKSLVCKQVASVAQIAGSTDLASRLMIKSVRILEAISSGFNVQQLSLLKQSGDLNGYHEKLGQIPVGLHLDPSLMQEYATVGRLPIKNDQQNSFIALKQAKNILQAGNMELARAECKQILSNDENEKIKQLLDFRSQFNPIWNPTDLVQDLLEMGAIEEAGKVAARLLAENPASENVIQVAAETFFRTKKYSSALPLLEVLALGEKKDADLLRTLSICYEETGQPKAAFKIRQVLTNLDQADTRDFLDYANTALECGLMDEAFQVTSKIYEREPHNIGALTLTGKAYAMKGNLDLAKEFFGKAIDLGPDAADPWIALAELQITESQVRKSIETLRNGITALPGNTQLKKKLAETLMESGSVSEAFPYLNELAENNQDVKIDLLRIEAMKTLGMPEYKELIEQLHTKHPENLELARERATELIKEGRHSEAKQIIQERMDDIKPGDEAALTYVDAIAGMDVKFSGEPKIISQQENEKVQSILTSSLGQNPNHTRAQLLQAELSLQKGLNSEAFSIYSKLMEKQASIDKTLLERMQAGFALAAAYMGNFELALAAIKQAVDAKPDWLGLRKIFAKIYALAGEISDAVVEAEKVFVAGSQIVESIIWFVDFVSGLGKSEVAEEKLKKAVSDLPGNITLLNNLAAILIQDGKTSEAKEIMASLKPDLSTKMMKDDLIHSAKNFNQIGDIESALACLKIIETQNEDLNSQLDHAGYLYLLNRYEDALKIVNNIQINNITVKLVNSIKADIFVKTGDLEQASIILDEISASLIEKPELDLNFVPESWQKIVRSDRPELEIQAKIKFFQGKARESLEAAKKWMDAEPNCLEARLLVYEACLAVGESIEEDIFPQIDIFSGDDLIAMHIIAYKIDNLLDNNQAIEAQQLYDKFIQTNSLAIKAVGIRIILLTGHLPEAEEVFNELVVATEQYNVLDANMIIGLTRLLVKAGIDLQRWNEVLTISNETANKYSWNLNCISQALSVLVQAKEQEEIGKSLSIEAHGTVDYFHQNKVEELFNMLAALAAGKTSNELEHWILRGKMAIDPVDENIRAFALITPTAEDATAMVAALYANHQNNTAFQVTKKFADNPHMLLELAKIQCSEDDLNSALETLNKYISIDPINPVGLAFRSLVFENSDKLDLAINDLEQAISDWPNETNWRTKAASLWQKYGNVKNAVFQLEAAYELKPEDADVGLQLGKECLELSNPDRTLEVVTPLTKNYPNLYEAWEIIANAHSMRGELAKALEAAQKAKVINPFSVKPYLMSGKLHLAAGDLQNACEQAKAAVTQNKKDADAILFLARVLHEKGEDRQALATLEATHRCENVTAQTMIDHVNLVREINGTASAKELIATLSGKFPENVELMKLLANAQEENGDVSDAEETAKKALQVDPDEPELHLFLGKINAESGQLDQAIHHLSQGIAHRTTKTDGYLLLSKVYEQQREFSKALDTLKQAMEFAPTDIRSYVAAANLYRNSKNYSAAEQVLQQAVEIDPQDVTLRRQLGALLALKLVHHSQEASTRS